MSFGFSVGDFIATGGLIKDLITCLSSSFLSSSNSYQELVLELQGLQLGLDRIRDLKGSGVQQLQVNGIRLAALNCQSILQDFLSKIRKYDASLRAAPIGVEIESAELSTNYVASNTASGDGKVKKMFKNARQKARTIERKVEWELKMSKEVDVLRAYLVAHVGSLNLSLSALGLDAVFVEHGHNQLFRKNITTKLESIEGSSTMIQTAVSQQGIQLQHSRDVSSIILNSVQSIDPQLRSILALAQQVSNSNTEIARYFSNLQATRDPPDLRRTWAQDPIKFEDALGRIIPVPSEYDVETLHAIILARFRTGPGQKEVHSGMFELFNSLDTNEAISCDTHSQLFPGMEITMAIIVGRYGKIERCPRPNCLSTDLYRPSVSLICRRCKSTFGQAKKQLPQPLRPNGFTPTNTSSSLAHTGNFLHMSNHAAELWKKTVQDQQKFRHIRIFISELPDTPPQSRLRIPLSHSRARQKLEAEELRASNTFANRLHSKTRQNLGMICESSPKGSTKSNAELSDEPNTIAGKDFKAKLDQIPPTGTGPYTIQTLDPQLFTMKSWIDGLPPYSALLAERRTTLPTSDASQSTGSKTQNDSVVSPMSSTGQYEHQVIEAQKAVTCRAPSGPQSIASAPYTVFGDWDFRPIYGPKSIMSLASAPDRYGSYIEETEVYGVLAQEMLRDQLSGVFHDTIPLDRTIAVQAQTSGLLNFKHREILDLRRLAMDRLKTTTIHISEGLLVAKELKADLEWTRRRMRKILATVYNRFPMEFDRANRISHRCPFLGPDP